MDESERLAKEDEENKMDLVLGFLKERSTRN